MSNAEIRLQLKGVGWRSVIRTSGSSTFLGQPMTIQLHVGYSHPVVIAIPQGVHVTNTSVPLGKGAQKVNTGKGSSKNAGTDSGGTILRLIATDHDTVKLGDFAARLQRIRPRCPYTGHGIIKRFTIPRTPKPVPAGKTEQTPCLRRGERSIQFPAPQVRKVGKRK